MPESSRNPETRNPENSLFQIRHRILIVDDNPLDRQAVIDALQRKSKEIDGIDADVLEAGTVAHAREALQQEEFACIFLDHNLPDGTALDLLMEVRSQGLVTPVVVLTGERGEETIAEVMRAGAADYLPKEKLHPDLVARSLRAALRFLQAQREKQDAFDELRARDRAIAAASNGIVIADPRQPDCPIVYTNEAFLRMTGYSQADVIGHNCRFLQGAETDPEAILELREAVQQQRGCQVQILNYRKDETTFWNEVTVSPVWDRQGKLTHFVGIQTDTTARHEADGERLRLLEIATRQAAELTAVIEAMPAGVYLGTENGIILSNSRGLEILGVDSAAELPQNIPALAALLETRSADTGERIAPGEEVFSRALRGEWAEQEVVHRNLRTGKDLVVRSAAAPILEGDRIIGAVSINNDVTEQKGVEEALRQSEERYRTVVEALTEGIIVQDAEGIVRTANPSAERILGLTIDEVTGRTSSDPRWEGIREDGSLMPGEEHPPMAALRTGQPQRNVIMGLRQPDGTLVWVSVNSHPISHSESGEALGVVSSFFDVTSQRQAQRELQARAARETLLNRIGQTLRISPNPEAVQEAAINLLGEALGADRCYFGLYDLRQGRVAIAQDWHRVDLASIQGVYPFTNTKEMFQELYRDSNTSVIQDAHAAGLSSQTIANMALLGLRSRVSVALADGDGLMATLTAAMADGPRAWTKEEVALVEAVGTQLRSAVEMARVTQREHNIATQLQEALQPELPGTVPGLALSRYYRPALAQSEGVGGDFYDVFAIEKGCTALVVGDLSGKGLAAASQVSTVRNMLRAFLYSLPTVIAAVTELNRVLAENNLLTGFTTLFVGTYDSAAGILKYVNCGQEPALLLRAETGFVEQLEPTGPILGTLESACYTESCIALAAGDALAIFTDGLTEVGASRTEMLGIEGVAALLAQSMPQDLDQTPEQRGEALALNLIAGVDAFAEAGARDDMCLLVSIVTAAGA
ncbi:MAG: PAS domain-containing protein [Janthinobacterium lividum]